MIRFTNISSEHGPLPINLYVKGENKTKLIYCAYALFETDELEDDMTEIYISVLDYKPTRSQREFYIFSEPLWQFQQDERTEEQQKFIDRNFDKLNDLYIEFAKSQGYLENV